jgi:pimeloyl-ACP methyl ester carboxylesterase
MAYIDLRGHQTWSVEYPNNGEPLLMLHGGLSSIESFDWQVLPAVADRFHPFGYDRTAHGRTGVREGFYHFEFQRDEAISYIEDVIGGPAHLLGHSDGGIIALLVAIKRPDLVLSIVASGVNYSWDCGLALTFDEANLEISEESWAKFHERSPDSSEWLPKIIRKAYEVWAVEPNITHEELATISAPVLVLNGDDEVFDAHHGVDLYRALPKAQLAIIPGATHAVLKEKNELALAIITDFYDHPVRACLTEEITPDPE